MLHLLSESWVTNYKQHYNRSWVGSNVFQLSIYPWPCCRSCNSKIKVAMWIYDLCWILSQAILLNFSRLSDAHHAFYGFFGGYYFEHFVYLSDQSAGHVLSMFIFFFTCIFNELIYVYSYFFIITMTVHLFGLWKSRCLFLGRWIFSVSFIIVHTEFSRKFRVNF